MLSYNRVKFKEANAQFSLAKTSSSSLRKRKWQDAEQIIHMYVGHMQSAKFAFQMTHSSIIMATKRDLSSTKSQIISSKKSQTSQFNLLLHKNLNFIRFKSYHGLPLRYVIPDWGSSSSTSLRTAAPGHLELEGLLTPASGRRQQDARGDRGWGWVIEEWGLAAEELRPDRGFEDFFPFLPSFTILKLRFSTKKIIFIWGLKNSKTTYVKTKCY